LSNKIRIMLIIEDFVKDKRDSTGDGTLPFYIGCKPYRILKKLRPAVHVQFLLNPYNEK